MLLQQSACFIYRKDAAAVVSLIQLGRRTAGLGGASFGPVRVAHCNFGGWRGAGRVEVTLYFVGLIAVLMRTAVAAAAAAPSADLMMIRAGAHDALDAPDLLY